MFAYPATDFYANVKVESLPESRYAELKKWLIANYDYLLKSDNNVQANTTLQSPLDGFDIRGDDRIKLEGGVLGFYLAFDDPAHVVTTIYLLNQQPYDRKFQTMEQYQRCETHFSRHISPVYE